MSYNTLIVILINRLCYTRNLMSFNSAFPVRSSPFSSLPHVNVPSRPFITALLTESRYKFQRVYNSAVLYPPISADKMKSSELARHKTMKYSFMAAVVLNFALFHFTKPKFSDGTPDEE